MEVLPNTDALLDTLIVFIGVDKDEQQTAVCLATTAERDRTIRMLFESYPATERVEACDLIISRAGHAYYYRGYLDHFNKKQP